MITVILNSGIYQRNKEIHILLVFVQKNLFLRLQCRECLLQEKVDTKSFRKSEVGQTCLGTLYNNVISESETDKYAVFDMLVEGVSEYVEKLSESEKRDVLNKDISEESIFYLSID